MLLRIEVPTAARRGPIEQTVWDEFLFNDKTTKQGRLTYRATTTDKSKATLLVRERNGDEPAVVAAEQWEFVDARTIRLLPAGTPFRIGAIYQLIYKAANPPVSGIGFAATRDLVSFLRYAAADDAGTPNPLAAAGRPAISARWRTATRRAAAICATSSTAASTRTKPTASSSTASIPNVAAGRTFLNYRFGQPNRIVPAGHGFMFFPGASFPFAYETQTDPFTGKSDGILARCTARGNCPKVIHTNSSTEYWQAGQSLVTTDPLGRSDGTPPDNVRIYHFAGTQHAGIEGSMPKGVCAMPSNQVDYRPLLRAALVSLDRWVKDGTPPPPSRYPRIADGTLVDDGRASRPIPGLTAAKGPSPRPRFDYGPDFDKGIIGKALPVALKDHYRVLVPEGRCRRQRAGGLRLPDIAVPTGTATGWSRVRAGRRRRRRAVLPRRLVPPLRQDQGRARGQRRPAPLARGALSRRRRLCRAGAAGGDRVGARGLPAAGGRQAHRRQGHRDDLVDDRFACPHATNERMTTTVLLTGFGPFPGAPFNPTGPLVEALARRRHPGLGDVRRVAHVFPRPTTRSTTSCPRCSRANNPTCSSCSASRCARAGCASRPARAMR